MSAPRPIPPLLVSVAAFLKRHEPWLRHTPRTNLLNFIEWYWRDGRVGIVRENGRIVAVALARATSDPEQTRMCSYYHDEQGKIVWIDHIASRHPAGIAILLRHAIQRFGPREAFAGEVFKREGQLRMLPFRIVERFSQTGDTPHGLPLNSCATRSA